MVHCQTEEKGRAATDFLNFLSMVFALENQRKCLIATGRGSCAPLLRPGRALREICRFVPKPKRTGSGPDEGCGGFWQLCEKGILKFVLAFFGQACYNQ